MAKYNTAVLLIACFYRLSLDFGGGRIQWLNTTQTI